MKKLFLLLFLVSCTSLDSNFNLKNSEVFFHDNLSFNEFKELLIVYSEKNPYPNLKE